MAKNNTQSRSAQRRNRGPDRPRQERTVRSLHPVVLDALFCVAIAVLAIFVYRGYIIEGKSDITPDVITQGAPFNRFALDFEERYNETPLWYPHIFGGMPFQASGTYHHLQYSFEALVNTTLPDRLISALHGRFFFHLLLGAVSMYFLGRALSLSRAASSVAAVAFVFSTHMMATEHANRFICFMHVPLIFLATYRVFDRGRPFDAVLLGGAFGSQLCSFHPQIAFYTAMLIGLYAVYVVIIELRDNTPLKTIMRKSALFTGGVVLAIAVAAVLVFPMQEYAQHSARNLSVGGSSVNVPFATSWSFPPAEMFTFVIPSFAGFGGQFYWGAMPFTDFPNYLGVVVIVLAVSGVVLRHSRMTVFLVTAVVLALLVSFGRHLPPVSYVMLHFIPFFAKFRAPVMILVLLQFSVALLAGYGMHAIIEHIRAGRDRLRSFARVLCTAAATVMLLVLLLTVFESSFQSFMTGIYLQADIEHGARSALVDNADYHARLNALRFDMFMGDLWTMALFMCAACGLLYATRKSSPVLFTAGISGLVVIDLFLVASQVVNPEHAPGRIEAYYEGRDNEIVQALKSDESLYRIMPVSEFTSNEYGYFGISTVGGYHAAKLGIYQELLEEVGFNTFPVLNMLNTRYLVTRQPLPENTLTPWPNPVTGICTGTKPPCHGLSWWTV